MCGRYAITVTPEVMRAFLAYEERPNFPPRYNVAPTQPIPVVHLAEGKRRFTLMRWGFVPGWVKDIREFPLVINIRAETVREKASFRAAFQRRRALMPADGFYEWQRLGQNNQRPIESRPFLLRRPDRGIFAFAALHETWHAADGSEIDTAALVNTTANGMISAIHERSPVILPPEHFAAWLDPETPPAEAHALLRPPPEDLLEMVGISRAINKVANDGPEVQLPPAAAPEAGRESPRRQAKKANGGSSDQGSLF
ncbi:MAG: SOS response-associated peptidase [Beijerinckiaceae bacterium]